MTFCVVKSPAGAALALCLSLISTTGADANAQYIIYAVPDARDAVQAPDGGTITGPLMTLDDALAQVRPGTTIQLLPCRPFRNPARPRDFE